MSPLNTMAVLAKLPGHPSRYRPNGVCYGLVGYSRGSCIASGGCVLAPGCWGGLGGEIFTLTFGATRELPCSTGT